MLVLTRNVGEGVYIDNDVRVTVLDVNGGQVKIGVEAPKEIAVHREEIFRRIQRERDLASESPVKPSLFRTLFGGR